MADPELQLRINSASQLVQRLQNELAVNQARESAIYRQQRQVNSELRAVRARIQDPTVSSAEKAQLTERGVQLESEYNQLERQGQEQSRRVQTLESEVRAAESELRVLQQQPVAEPSSGRSAAQAVQAQQPNGPTSPPQQTVNDDGFISQPRRDTQPTNADLTPTQDTGDIDLGTDAPLRTIDQTQATGFRFDSPGALRDETGQLGTIQRNPVLAATTPGVGALDDMAVPEGVVATGDSNTQAAIPVTFDEKIIPQPNILDRFSTYTYQASMYLLTTEQYEAYQASGKKSVQGYNLLFQSGGAANNQFGPQQSPAGNFVQDGRNPFFPVDFYIDAITLENRLFGKATQAAHSVATMKFTVIEPANISLIDRLYLAVQNIAPRDATGAVNYAAAVYLMVIRFYGYDESGNIVPVSNAGGLAGTSNSNAVVEKFIPFRIRYINWEVANRLVTYEFDCAPIGQQIGFGTRRGTIPKDVEASGATVSQMLSGEVVYSTTQGTPDSPGATTTGDPNQSDAETARLNRQAGAAPPAPAKAVAARNNKQTVKQGLMSAINIEQQRLVKDGIYEVADIYEIEFANGAEAIRDATVTKPGAKVNKSATPMVNGQQDTSVRSPDKNSMDTTSRNFGVTAGMQTVQAIDLIIRNSNYITDQATIVINESTRQPEPNPRSKPNEGVKWFNILVQATPLKYDNLRNDYAYRIKYVIVPYAITDLNSPYFPPGLFRGVHKKYPYWFTGENIAVLDYKASFNKLYNLTVSGSASQASFLQKQRLAQTHSMRDIPFYQYQARSTESSQGAENKANEVAANAAEYLYNPSDNANATVRIIGDPAWIQQASLAGLLNPRNFSYSAFEPDGSINFDTNDIMFEIAWQRPEDYDEKTGVADPYARTQNTFGDRSPIQSVVYRARKVVSEFRNGRFEQVLDGTLYSYPVPPKSNQAPNAASTAGDSETARLSPQSPSSGRIGPGSLGSGLSNAGFNVDNLGVPGVSGLAESARLKNYGGPGLRIPDSTQWSTVKQTSGEFIPSAVSPWDTLQSALPSLPATSNGTAAGIGDSDNFASQEQSIAVANEIPADQIARNASLNRVLTGLLPVPKLPNLNIDNISSQDISREP